MKELALIGIDLGTTSVKVISYAADGKPLAQAQQSYRHSFPQARHAEQDPQELAGALWKALRVVAEQTMAMGCAVEALSFSAMMHGIFMVDGAGVPRSQMMTWADSRASLEIAQIKSVLGLTYYRRTGTPLHAMSPLAKIAWLRAKRKEDFALPGVRFVSLKEWIVWQLTGEWAVDYATATATGLCNLHTFSWDAEGLDYVGITAEQLSPPLPATTIFRLQDQALARFLCLPVGLPIVIGATDGTLANLGSGVIHSGALAVTLGTSGAVRTVVAKPWTDAQGRTFCYALTERHFVIGGGVNSGGLVLRWVREQLLLAAEKGGDRLAVRTDQELLALASQAPAGSGGVLFLPYLAGERAPHYDERARGVLFGMGLEHTHAHLARAVMEGMAFSLYAVYDVLRHHPLDARTLIASGGYARSPFWRALLCDLFALELRESEVEEASCFGAFLLAQFALGKYAHLEETVARFEKPAGKLMPQADAVRVYRDLFPLYRRLYERLQDVFFELSALQL